MYVLARKSAGDDNCLYTVATDFKDFNFDKLISTMFLRVSGTENGLHGILPCLSSHLKMSFATPALNTWTNIGSNISKTQERKDGRMKAARPVHFACQQCCDAPCELNIGPE